MKSMRLHVAWLAFVIVFLLPLNVHAYVDPGTGSYLLQITLGLLFGSLYAVKVGWHRIVRFFSRHQNPSDDAPK